LLALYADRSATPRSPATEAMLTIEPERAASISRPKARLTRNGPVEVDVQHAPPGGHVEVLGRADGGDPGVVDHDVDPTELPHRRVGAAGHVRLVGHIAGDRERVREPVDGLPVQQHQPVPLGAQRLRRAAADALCRPP